MLGMYDDEVITEPVPAAGAELVVWSEDGRFLVTGVPGAVDRFVATLEPERELRIASAGPIADGLAALSTGAGMVGRIDGRRYVEVSAKHWDTLKRQGVPDHNGAYMPMIRGGGGKFVEQVRMRPVGSLANGMPQTAIALAALRLAIQEMQEAVEAVARDVADLRRIAETAEIGNLAGVYRVLANARSQVDETGSITQATWDSIAPHEVTVQQSADRLRALLRRTLEDLPLEADTGERYAAARRLLDEQTIGRSLKLLVLAEQCRLLWRSLKLDQVRRSEPEALAGEADAAKAMLADNAHADQALIAALHAALVALGKVGPLDGVRVFTKGKLPTAVADLREQVNQFASQREQQLDSWAPDPTPTISDAARQVGALAEQAAIEGKRVVGSFLVGLGSKLQSGAESNPEPQRRDP